MAPIGVAIIGSGIFAKEEHLVGLTLLLHSCSQPLTIPSSPPLRRQTSSPSRPSSPVPSRAPRTSPPSPKTLPASTCTPPTAARAKPTRTSSPVTISLLSSSPCPSAASLSTSRLPSPRESTYWPRSLLHLMSLLRRSLLSSGRRRRRRTVLVLLLRRTIDSYLRLTMLLRKPRRWAESHISMFGS